MLKKFLKSLIVILLAIILNDLFISYSTQLQTFTTASSIPAKKVGLLLGTSKYTVNGEVNLFYKYRLQAAKDLYDNNKVEFLILSGDNSTQNYNEPYTMQQDLLELGLPEEKLFLDHAGFRTLDSVVRASKVFDEDNFIIISQNFHNQRALFIANNKNIQAIAFNAKDVPTQVSLRVFIREKLARVKTVIDLFFKVEPKFLGEKILIK
ncbi:protein SanA [bacterium]|nr:protein SanA [bacterium]|tara:strand:- start:5826 stop:6449 length:624 start_codon:yes stop_codon:yes gene_type:complete